MRNKLMNVFAGIAIGVATYVLLNACVYDLVVNDFVADNMEVIFNSVKSLLV